MPFLRRTREPRNLTDYRQAAREVIERRRSGERPKLPADDPQNPAESYEPRERLHGLETRVENLVSDARSIPRIWEPELPDPQLGTLSQLNFRITGAAVFAVLGLAAAFDFEPRSVAAFAAFSLLSLGACMCVGIVKMSRKVRGVYPWHYWIAMGLVALNTAAWPAAVWLVVRSTS